MSTLTNRILSAPGEIPTMLNIIFHSELYLDYVQRNVYLQNIFKAFVQCLVGNVLCFILLWAGRHYLTDTRYCVLFFDGGQKRRPGHRYLTLVQAGIYLIQHRIGTMLFGIAIGFQHSVNCKSEKETIISKSHMNFNWQIFVNNQLRKISSTSPFITSSNLRQQDEGGHLYISRSNLRLGLQLR